MVYRNRIRVGCVAMLVAIGVLFSQTVIAQPVGILPAEQPEPVGQFEPENSPIQFGGQVTAEAFQTQLDRIRAEAQARARQGDGRIQFTDFGLAYIDYRNLLPAAPDNNFFFASPFRPASRVGSGYATASSLFGLQNVYNRIGGNVNFGATYNTGFMLGPEPFQIALDGTADARRSGTFNMSPFDASRLIWDIGTTETATTAQTQAYVELDYTGGDVTVRNAFGRLVSGSTGQQITLGQQQSFVEDVSALPTTLSGSVIGSLRNNNFGVNYTKQYTNWQYGFAVENPQTDFQTVLATDVQLTRYPMLSGRVRYVGDNLVDRFQLAGFVRWFGAENVVGAEDWVPGWGVTLVGRRAFWNDQAAFYYGVAGGEGVGSRIVGIESGAAGDLGQLATLKNFGAYSGLAHLWHQDDCGRMLWSNIVAGYSYQGSSSNIAPQSIRRARQLLANVIYRAGKNTAYGVEYSYMDKDVRSGLEGDNHQIQLFVMFTTTDEGSNQAAPASIQSLATGGSSGGNGSMYLRGL